MAVKVHKFKKDLYRKQSIDKVNKKENMFEFFKDYGQRQQLMLINKLSTKKELKDVINKTKEMEAKEKLN